MALKIKTSLGMKTIDTTLHKPVVFVGGQKKIINKAWTFVNGEKRMIWGDEGVIVDFIQTDGLATGNVFSIGETWCNTYLSKDISTLDISNLSNIFITQTVAWGRLYGYNGFQSTVSEEIFITDARVNNSGNINKLSLDPLTGSLSVIEGRAENNDRYLLSYTDSYTILYSRRTKVFTPSSTTVVRYYGDTYYWNGTSRYSTGRQPANVTDTSGDLTKLNGGLQVDSDAILVNLSGAYSPGTGLYLAEYSGINKQRGTILQGLDKSILDDEKICCNTDTKFTVNDKTSYAELFSYTVSDASHDRVRFLGKIDNYYYLVEIVNAYASSGATVKLILINDTSYQTEWEQSLPTDPFNENNGKATFWTSGVIVPQVSRSGFLALSTYNNSTIKLRIARIGQLS